jgi:glycosyltransferase involved in cell wall biosynthesis
MKVINFTLYRANPYSRMMYSALEPDFEAVRGTVDDALSLLRADEAQLFHINWEEHLIRKSSSAAEAELMTEYFIKKLKEYRKLGGKVVWTVHNEQPHELEFVGAFLNLRRQLASNVDRILVHSTQAIAVLNRQVQLDHSLLFFVPHPSYLGEYEEEPKVAPSWERPTEPIALAFGMVRHYKGYSSFLETIEARDDCQFRVRVVGAPVSTDSYGEELRVRHESSKIEFDYRHVPPEEVAATVRAARCLVLPYERFLTSGVALLGLTLGVPVVAPDSPQMRESLPKENHPFLFESGNGDDLVRAINQAVHLPTADFGKLVQAHFERAVYCSPENVSRRLGTLFRSLLEKNASSSRAPMSESN